LQAPPRPPEARPERALALPEEVKLAEPELSLERRLRKAAPALERPSLLLPSLEQAASAEAPAGWSLVLPSKEPAQGRWSAPAAEAPGLAFAPLPAGAPGLGVALLARELAAEPAPGRLRRAQALAPSPQAERTASGSTLTKSTKAAR
jgi:hypothetical protein